MEMKISFPGNKKVAASFGAFTVLTDQPKEAGGDGGAPAPFDLFLASLGTCAGIFALSFCQKRGIATEGLELLEKIDWDDAAHRVAKVSLEIVLPPGFPDKYVDTIRNAVELCTVKRTIAAPPVFEVRTVVAAASRRTP